MDREFAARLIEDPDESTIKELFRRRIAGLFWVDWREASDEIIRLAAKCIWAYQLKPIRIGDRLTIFFNGHRTEVPLKGVPGEQDITLATLNQALQPDYEIRFVKASDGGDTLAFFLLDDDSWAELEILYGEKIDDAFARIDKGSSFFGRPEEAAQPELEAQILEFKKLPFHRITFDLLTQRAAADLLSVDKGMEDGTPPVVEPAFGDIRLAYSRNTVSGHRHVTQRDVEKNGLSTEELRGFALSNARAAWRRSLKFHSEGGIQEGRGDEAACLALSPSFWDDLVRQGGSLVAAFPQRQLVLLTRAGPEGVAALRRAVKSIDFDDSHSLSRHVYRWDAGTWEIEP